MIEAPPATRHVLLIEPMGKPRVLKGEQSKVATRWRRYKNDVLFLAQKAKLELPDGFFHVIFYVTPPRSMSAKKRFEIMGLPVRVKPDVDNFVKGFLDALFENDSHVWDLRSTKLYGDPGRIEILF